MKLSALPVMSNILLFSMFLPIILIHTALQGDSKAYGQHLEWFCLLQVSSIAEETEHRHSIDWVVDSKLHVECYAVFQDVGWPV